MTYIPSEVPPPSTRKATELAFLVCKNCNIMWATAEPGEVKYGIVLEAKKEYLTVTCNSCNNGSNSYKLEKIESFIKALNFSSVKLGSLISETARDINIRIYQFHERLQRLWAEVGLQVCPQAA